MFKKLLVIFVAVVALSAQAQPLDSLFRFVKYRNIGPFRGGRSVCASGVVNNPLVYYMGTTGGGLWKTENAGALWTNISDGFFKTGSVGAVSVSESDPNVVYVGMGEHAPRGVMTSYGDGVYKSTDAGKTWKKMGLEKTLQIARIIIHPKNPDIVWVAAQGAINGPTTDRGIYKSTDGGVTWRKALFVNDLTGCSELSLDHSNPQVLYATMWHHQRLPWKVISGGPGSGVYKSTDGGESWNKIQAGLPKELGKMAIAVSRVNPDKVFLLLESDTEKEQGGLFVSENGGKDWDLVSSDHRLVQRAWYYIEVFADTQEENTVYVLSAPALKSIDGGKTWESFSAMHGDHHDMWINPNNSKNLVIADDGGASITYDRCKTWSLLNNMPTAQFYRVNMDNHFPYRMYGGQQDNSSVRIQHLALGGWGIGEPHWTSSAGGESAFLAFNPDDPTLVLGGSYLGTIEALNTKANAGTSVMAAPINYIGRETKNMKYRFNWNAPIIWSQHEPGTFYHGAQLLLRTRDNGVTWEEASPDLTRNEKEKQGKGGGPYTNEAVGAENYGTLAYVIESPHEKGVIWTGSDDGYVQLTRDGGKTWANVTPKGLAECLVNAIEVSPHDKATAYIATTRFKFNDFTPGLYKTTDYGKTWTNISKGIPVGAYTRVVREDPVRKNMLFAGTETGMYISWDGGANWQPFQLNLPIVPITDLMIKHNDMAIATMGRSFWVLDDMGLLRQHAGKDEGFKLYQPEDAIIGNWGSQLNSSSEYNTGRSDYQGVNPANGVIFYYGLPKLADSVEVMLEIRDSEGNLVRKISTKRNPDFRSYAGGPPSEPVMHKTKGLNRFVWDMRHAVLIGAPTAYIEGSFRGHKASPGTYQAVLKYGATEAKTTFKILPNPLFPTTVEHYSEYHKMMTILETNFNDMHTRVNKVLKMRGQIEAVLKELPKENKYAAIRKQGQELVKKMEDWDATMIQRKSKAYDDVDNFENKFTADYLFLLNQVEGDIPRVTKPAKDLMAEFEKTWAGLKFTSEDIITKDVPAFTKLLWDNGVGAVYHLK